MSELLTAIVESRDENPVQTSLSAISTANKQSAVGVSIPVLEEGGGVSIGRTNRPQTLNDALAQVTEREAGLRRTPFPLSQVRVVPGRLIVGEREFLLGDEGMHRLCRRFQAPAEYLARLKPQLRAHILQEHFAEGRDSGRKLGDRNSCIVSRDDSFIDLARSDLFNLDSTDVLRAVGEGVGAHASTLEVQNLHLDDESFALEVVSPRLAEEVRAGDVIRAGVHVSHSQLDGKATQVMAYLLRQICTNGVVQRECLGEKRRSTPRARRLSAERPEAREMQIAQIRKLVADTWSGLGNKLEAIRRLQDKPVQVRTALERFLTQAHLFTHGLMERLLQAWVEEGSEPSAFGVLNALSRVATHSQEMPAWQRQRLARLAGIYANQDLHLCPHCFSVLAA